MKTRHLLAVSVAILAFAGCSIQSPTAPDAQAAAISGPGATEARTSASGSYLLSFVAHVDGTLQEVTSLPVLSTELPGFPTELILRAYVTSSGEPAPGGTVTFEYCSYKGGPANDITRPDEAPKEACEQGTARWARLTSVSVTAESCPSLGNGYACMNFGIVRIPRQVGFRFRYSPQGTPIGGGTSEAKNFTWVSTL